MEPFGERVKNARPRRLSGIEASFQIRDVTPRPHQLGYATISRLERDLIEEDKADVVALAGLAKIYGVPLERISPVAAERAREVIKLLVDVTGPDRPLELVSRRAAKRRSADQGVRASGCKAA